MERNKETFMVIIRFFYHSIYFNCALLIMLQFLTHNLFKILKVVQFVSHFGFSPSIGSSIVLSVKLT